LRGQEVGGGLGVLGCWGVGGWGVGRWGGWGLGEGGLERYSNLVGFMPTWKPWTILGVSDIGQGSLDIDKRTSLFRQGNKQFYSTGAWLR
jgi:hypothetical protein